MPQIQINGINAKQLPKGSWKVGIFTKDKDGNDIWINGFLDRHPDWQKGQTIELEVWRDDKWGLQFKAPEQEIQTTQPAQTNNTASTNKQDFDRLKALEDRMMIVEGIVLHGKSLGQQKQETTTQELADELGGEIVDDNKEIKVEDIPF